MTVTTVHPCLSSLLVKTTCLRLSSVSYDICLCVMSQRQLEHVHCSPPTATSSDTDSALHGVAAPSCAPRIQSAEVTLPEVALPGNPGCPVPSNTGKDSTRVGKTKKFRGREICEGPGMTPSDEG